MSFLVNLKSLFRGKVNLNQRFELLRAAISGTMSSFYMARDRRSGEVMGLKVLDIEKTRAFEARFAGLDKPSEGEIAVQFQHPHIVKTLEHGVSSTEQPYLVMEFLDGPGLNSLIIGRSRNLEGRRVPLIRQAAQALAAVHKAGFIHRDICPRNFVVDAECQSLKLIDFGLTVPATPSFMQPGNRTGTANYMAPEVVRRRSTDQRLDIFSFGVTAFETCTFELPWPRGDSGLAAMQHGTVDPIDIRTLRPLIAPQLATAIMACISPDAKKRPQSMEAFLSMIEHVEQEDIV